MAAVAFHLALPEMPPMLPELAEEPPAVEAAVTVHQVEPPPPPPPAKPAPPRAVTLQVSGSKPLKMRARLLAEGSSWSAEQRCWHEVAVYQREAGEHAVAVKTFRKAPGEQDMFRAELFPTRAEALDWIEAFDPTADLSISFDASDRSVSAAEIALRAAALRLRADEVTRQYQVMVGDLLYRIDAMP